MKVVLAVMDNDSHVIGLLRSDNDEVVFMNNWLHKLEFGRLRPYKFKVYNFEPGHIEPMTLGTMVYPVTYDSLVGKVDA